MKKIISLLIVLCISLFTNAQLSPDFEPCIGSGDSTGLGNLRLLIAQSDDGINWTRTKMVLSDRSSVADALVLPSGRIMIYYVAGCIDVGGSYQKANHIKVAISDDDGISWVYKNVTFNEVPNGATLPVDPNVVLLPNGDIHLIGTIDPDQSGSQKPCSYSALSTDGGFTFQVEGQSFSVSDQDLLDPENYKFNDTTWYIWCGGVPGKNRLAKSTDDGATFADHDNFCSDTNTFNPSNCYIVADVMRFNDTTYKMWVFGESANGQNIRSLSSKTDTGWTADEDFTFMTENNGVEYMDVWAPTVVKLQDDSYLMIYETRIPSSADTTFDSISISPSDTVIDTGDSLKFIARMHFSDNSIRDITHFCTWHTDNSSIVSIDDNGILTAKEPGTANIYYIYDLQTSDTVLVTVNIVTGNNAVPKENFNLSVCPNPVENSGNIVFHLNEGQKVIIELLDIYGRPVSTLADKEFSKGNHSIFFTKGNLKAGCYFCKATFKNSASVIKIILK